MVCIALKRAVCVVVDLLEMRHLHVFLRKVEDWRVARLMHDKGAGAFGNRNPIDDCFDCGGNWRNFNAVAVMDGAVAHKVVIHAEVALTLDCFDREDGVEGRVAQEGAWARMSLHFYRTPISYLAVVGSILRASHL